MQLLDGKKPLEIVKFKKNGNVNAKGYGPNDLIKEIFLLPINYCSTLCDIGNNIGVFPETIHALVKAKKLCEKRRNLKTHLTNEHKKIVYIG